MSCRASGSPEACPADLGVVAEGPVGTKMLGHLRLFRYEVRRWRAGIVPDLCYAVASPVRVTDRYDAARRTFELLPEVPTAVWGGDQFHAGDMWSCNSVISWTLVRAGVDIGAVPLSPHGRAPGWAAGVVVARRGGEVATAADVMEARMAASGGGYG